VLARHQRRQPPARDGAVDRDLLAGRQPVPEFGAVDVDEIVGDQPAVPPSGAVERLRPVDVGRRVPLVELGLLVEVAEVGVLAVIIVAEVRDVADVDLMPAP
jgi:hypothetical protein